MVTLFDQGGFLLTRASTRADLSLVLILFSACLFTLGWYFARAKRWPAHRWTQTLAVTLNTVVVLLTMVEVFIRNYLTGIPANLSSPVIALTVMHALTGAVGIALGVFILLSAKHLLPASLRLKNDKMGMRISYTLYMVLSLGGLLLYFYMYVI